MSKHEHTADETCCHSCRCHKHIHDGNGESPWLHTYRQEIACGLLWIVAAVLGHAGAYVSINHALFPQSEINISRLVMYLLALLPVALPILKGGWRLWSKGDILNEFTLMLTASAGAFIIGEYTEGVAVLLFYSLGEKMEESASEEARRRVRGLIGKLPSVAHVLRDGKNVDMAPDEVAVGSVISVLPGERIPIDAVLNGDAAVSLDTSAITGESVPRSFAPGSVVKSGMIPLDTRIELTTTHPFNESSMSRIVEMIENARKTKSPTETTLRRITKWYTPLVFVLAALLVAVPWIISVTQGVPMEWYKWCRRVLVLLVCSCPCALVVGIPLCYFASIGNASKRGLLFKGSKYLDLARQIKTVVFDKTGTLTTGRFNVSKIVPAAGHTAEEVAATAASLDCQSAHPFAKAITKYASEKHIGFHEADKVMTVPHGMEGFINGKKVFVGSRKLMSMQGIEIPLSEGEGSEICVVSDGIYIGSIFLIDEIKPEAEQAVKEIRRLGVNNISIFSGDAETAVARVARVIGVDTYKAALLPDDKQKLLDDMRAKGDKCAFVGDGINDSPSIAAADLGIAMGGAGTDIAMDSSDLVIVSDRLTKIPEAMRLSRKVRNVVIENVGFALFVKALVMILGVFGIATLWAAVFADTGVTLIVVIWTLLRLRN